MRFAGFVGSDLPHFHRKYVFCYFPPSPAPARGTLPPWTYGKKTGNRQISGSTYCSAQELCSTPRRCKVIEVWKFREIWPYRAKSVSTLSAGPLIAAWVISPPRRTGSTRRAGRALLPADWEARWWAPAANRNDLWILKQIRHELFK